MKARNPSTGNLESVYVKALDSLPVGTILEFPTTSSSNLPIGYMFCDGSAISRTTYSELFSLIGTSYGSGDGSTTFNLPNYKDRVPVGYDSTQTEFNAIGKTGGNKTASHTHGLSDGWADIQLRSTGEIQYHEINVGTYTWSANYKTNGTNAGDVSATGNYGAQLGGKTESGSASTLQPYIVTNYIIKVSQTRALAGKTVNAFSNSTTDAYSCDYVNDRNTYSTSETFTGKYWIDGKPIYRKVVPFTLSSTTGSFQYQAHGISNIGTYRHIELYYTISEGYWKTPNDAIVEIGVTSANIQYYNNNNSYVAGQDAYAILEYTKTS